MPITTVAFIGAGRIGSALAARLRERDYSIVAVFDTQRDAAERLSRIVGAETAQSALEAAQEADVVFITTPDDTIGRVVGEVALAGGWRAGSIVVHTSGALSSSTLDPAARIGAYTASFHPLQTFPAGVEDASKFANISIAIEGDEGASVALRQMASDLGGRPFEIQPEDKILYHAAAVMASNYLVAEFAVAVRMLSSMGLDPEDAAEGLLPLVSGTFEAIREPGLPKCLTGPVARGDAGTVEKHIEAIRARFPDLLNVYCALGKEALEVACSAEYLDHDQAAALRRLFESCLCDKRG